MNVTKYMVYWSSLSLAKKREIMHEWSKVVSYLVVQYKEANQTYMLPTLLSTDEKYLILRNGLTGLLDMGRKFVNTAIRNPDIINAKRGKMGVLSSKGKANIELYVTLNSFFDELSNEGLLFSTRLVREDTGLTARDYDPDNVVLPLHISKHRCYARWCYQMVWMVEKKSKNNIRTVCQIYSKNF